MLLVESGVFWNYWLKYLWIYLLSSIRQSGFEDRIIVLHFEGHSRGLWWQCRMRFALAAKFWMSVRKCWSWNFYFGGVFLFRWILRLDPRACCLSSLVLKFHCLNSATASPLFLAYNRYLVNILGRLQFLFFFPPWKVSIKEYCVACVSSFTEVLIEFHLMQGIRCTCIFFHIVKKFY